MQSCDANTLLLFAKTSIARPATGFLSLANSTPPPNQYISAVIINESSDVGCLSAYRLLGFSYFVQYPLNIAEFQKEFIKMKAIWGDGLRLVRIIVGKKYTQDAEGVVKLIKLAQTLLLAVILVCELDSRGQFEYQKSLFSFSRSLLEQPGLLLEAISVELQLPKIENYFKIWQRVLPLALNSLVLQEWQERKRVLALHFIKELPLTWRLQFITSSAEEAQRLGLECAGIQ